MPWEAILATVGSSGLFVIVVVVLGLVFGQRLVEALAESIGKRVDEPLTRDRDEHLSALQQQQEAFTSALALQAEEFRSALSRSTAIDTDLRDKRVIAYTPLWRLTEALPRWPRDEKVTYEALREFSEQLRRWYFQKGGMWLSTQAFAQYKAVQEAIWSLLDPMPESDRAKHLSCQHYEAIRERCSLLRTELTEDLSSRLDSLGLRPSDSGGYPPTIR